MNPFDLQNSPLEGIHLIEAGAGTGKTYAIAGLYVRLLLEKALTVHEILVVTFTLAATAELKDRIRRKIRDALDALSSGESEDTFLQGLASASADPDVRRLAAERLRAALRDFDEAAIFTIHGFCQRMLQEHAFESGVLFETDLLTDQNRLKEEIIQDFWRTRFYGAPPELIDHALKRGISPASLLVLAGNAATNPDIRVLPDNDPPSLASIHAARERFRATHAGLQAQWPGCREAVHRTLQDPALKATMYGPKMADRLVSEMDAWLTACSPVLFKGFEKLTPGGIANGVRKNATCPEHPVFTLCQSLQQQAAALVDALDRYLLFLKADLIRILRTELPGKKQRQNILFFDDLLFKLREALQKEGGEALAAVIRGRFKAALIDEFQDTDAIQYAIFQSIFGRDDHTLFLIGDPKQAIYSFRGADIFAYMQAAAAVRADCRHTLDRNWRSEPGLVTAVNTLFSKPNHAFVYAEIAFREAEAAANPERNILTLDGRQEPPFEWWFAGADSLSHRDPPTPKDTARARISAAVAAEISRLIRLGREGRALIGTRPVTEGDMAVLVRSNRETHLIQKALQDLRIASVLASEENIFDSPEAAELCQVLQAVAYPIRESLVRGALATDLLGADGAALEQWQRDDAGWAARLEAFRQDRDLWETRGFMRMFRTLTAREGIRQRLLCYPNGERRLTNLLHLAEILHQESIARNLDSERLLQWLAKQMDRKSREVRDEHLLRLESDANAVTILTIHKSKGLEWPIVFCPFAWAGSRIKGGPFSFHDETRNRALTLDLGSAERDRRRAAAERELLAENCRLLYVALTRAKHRCYFAWGRINQTGSSAPFYLFHGNGATLGDSSPEGPVNVLEERMKTLSGQDMLEEIAAIAAVSGGTIRLQELPELPGVVLSPGLDRTEDTLCRTFKRHIDTSWKVASYSLLISAPSALLEQPDRDAVSAPAPADAGPEAVPHLSPAPGRNLFAFPGGSRSGILIHDLLEHFDFAETEAAEHRRLTAEKLKQHGFDPQWEEALTEMLRNIAACPLPRFAASEAAAPSTLRLSSVSRSARLNELEFYFPLRLLSRERLHAAFGEGQWEQTGFERLHFNPVQGFMHGFIDMVFEHEGRFYLVDWKSNFLGPDLADYTPSALRKAMEAHFYILQSRLYAVALDRYLAQRLPGYTYETHFGGIYYLFIRGMNPAAGPACGVHADRPDARFIKKLGTLLIAEP